MRHRNLLLVLFLAAILVAQVSLTPGMTQREFAQTDEPEYSEKDTTTGGSPVNDHSIEAIGVYTKATEGNEREIHYSFYGHTPKYLHTKGKVADAKWKWWTTDGSNVPSTRLGDASAGTGNGAGEYKGGQPSIAFAREGYAIAVWSEHWVSSTITCGENNNQQSDVERAVIWSSVWDGTIWGGGEIVTSELDDVLFLDPSIAIDSNGLAVLLFTKEEIHRDNLNCASKKKVSVQYTAGDPVHLYSSGTQRDEVLSINWGTVYSEDKTATWPMTLESWDDIPVGQSHNKPFMPSPEFVFSSVGNEAIGLKKIGNDDGRLYGIPEVEVSLTTSGMAAWWGYDTEYQISCDDGGGNQWTRYYQSYWPRTADWNAAGSFVIDSGFDTTIRPFPGKPVPTLSSTGELVNPVTDLPGETSRISLSGNKMDQISAVWPVAIWGGSNACQSLSFESTDLFQANRQFTRSSEYPYSVEVEEGGWIDSEGNRETNQWHGSSQIFETTTSQSNGVGIAYLPLNGAVVLFDKTDNGGGSSVEYRQLNFSSTNHVPTGLPSIGAPPEGSSEVTDSGNNPTIASMAHGRTVALWLDGNTLKSSFAECNSISDFGNRHHQPHPWEAPYETRCGWSHRTNQDGPWAPSQTITTNLAARSTLGEGGVPEQPDIAALTGSPTMPHAEWTHMSYIVADTNLHTWEDRYRDQLMSDLPSEPLLNNVVLYDPMGGKSTAPYNDGHTRYEYISWNKHTTLHNHEENLNMGDKETLSTFISTSIEHFPANRIAMTMTDHGGGWKGTCYDENPHDSLGMRELGNALKESTRGSFYPLYPDKIDILFFDQCLMSQIEVAFEIREYVDVMIASEPISYADTTRPGSMLDQLRQPLFYDEGSFPVSVHEHYEWIWSSDESNWEITQVPIAALDTSSIGYNMVEQAAMDNLGDRKIARTAINLVYVENVADGLNSLTQVMLENWTANSEKILLAVDNTPFAESNESVTRRQWKSTDESNLIKVHQKDLKSFAICIRDGCPRRVEQMSDSLPVDDPEIRDAADYLIDQLDDAIINEWHTSRPQGSAGGNQYHHQWQIHSDAYFPDLTGIGIYLPAPPQFEGKTTAAEYASAVEEWWGSRDGYLSSNGGPLFSEFVSGGGSPWYSFLDTLVTTYAEDVDFEGRRTMTKFIKTLSALETTGPIKFETHTSDGDGASFDPMKYTRYAGINYPPGIRPPKCGDGCSSSGSSICSESPGGTLTALHEYTEYIDWVLNGTNLTNETSYTLTFEIMNLDKLLQNMSINGILQPGQILTGRFTPDVFPPTIVSEPSTSVIAGQTYDYTPEADGTQSITWTLGDDAPEGVTIDPQTGVVNWDTTEDDVGTHSIQMIAENDIGFDAQNITVVVTSSVNPLTALVESNVSNGTAPLATAFSTTVSGGSSPYDYSWDFGDGSTGSGAAPTHVYQNAGDYTAIVTITDADDSTIQRSLVVSVSQEPGGEVPNADDDDDSDGWTNALEEACGTDPLDATSIPLDYDNDTECDMLDGDDDNDGVDDAQDAFPLDSTESVDTDGDGTGDNADTDDDNDGWSDADETECGTSPIDPNSVPKDLDGDGECDGKNDGKVNPEGGDENPEGGEGDWPTPEMIAAAVAVFVILLLVPIIIVLRNKRMTERRIRRIR